jgi:GNAT superfamily N-acetyltransferase
MRVYQAEKSDAALLSRLNLAVQLLHAKGCPEIFKMPAGDGFAVGFYEIVLGQENTYVFIVEDEGEARGYIFMRVMHREGNILMYPWSYLYIDQISVEPPHQGKGYGRVLMEKANELAEEHGLDQILLDSWFFNQGAHSFFEKQGFEVFNLRMWRKL